MKIIEGKPKEIAAYELALKDGNRDYLVSAPKVRCQDANGLQKQLQQNLKRLSYSVL
jgi:hypothetical protein